MAKGGLGGQVPRQQEDAGHARHGEGVAGGGTQGVGSSGAELDAWNNMRRIGLRG
jgi:hypothetical protein